MGLWLTIAGCATPGDTADADELARQIRAMEQRSLLREAFDDGDLRPAARKILAQLRVGSYRVPPLPRGMRHAVTLPSSIRLWRRSLGGSDSCKGKVEVIPLERYIKGVLPHEWISSWKQESLRAGAVAIRSYASSWIEKGGKYTCADLDDTTRSQVYKDSTKAVTNDAVDATAGLVLVKGGKIVFAEYSAENGDPTKYNVSDPPCAGKKLFGHGRGMCQWGSQRWATRGKDHRWIALHYYPGASLLVAGATVPKPDLTRPPADGGRPPGDRGQTADTTPAEAGLPRADTGSLFSDVGFLGGDLGTITQASGNTLSGGCNVGEGEPDGVVLVLTLALLLARRRRVV